MKLKYRVIERFRGKYSIGAMCKVFEVSRSGYYAWRTRQQKEAKDQRLVDLVTACQQQSKQTYGIRRRSPYTRYQQAVHKSPNLLDRAFGQAILNQFWVTDIIYITIPGNMLYMCAVLALYGKGVLAWKIGADMSSSLVTNTIREALKREKVTGGLTLHSDQGSQYTSQAYFDLTRAYFVSPSMSSPGCPYDHAVIENFFGTLKTECLYRIHFTTRTEVEQLVTEYVDFYNFERISLKNGLTPIEIKSKTV